MAGVSVTIGANTEQFDAAVKRSKSQLNQLSTEFKAGAVQAAKFGAAAVAAGAAMAAGLTVKGLAAVDAQAKLARQLGASIDGLRATQIAASDAGVSMGVMQSAAERLNQRIGEAQRGTGTAAESFKRLGLDAQALGQMDVDQRMATIADRMHGLGLSTAEAADELRQMGIRNTEMVNLMLQGGDAIRNARGEVDELGLSLSEIDAAKVEAANDSFARIGMVIEGISQRLAIEVAPILDAVSKMFTDAAKEAGGFGEAASDAFEFVVDSAAFVMNAVDGIKRVFELVADGVIVAWNAMASLVAKHIENIVTLVDKIPGVDMSDTLSAIRSFADQAESVVASAMGNMHETLMRPMAGDQFKGFVAEAREAAQAAAAESVSLADMLMGDPEEFEERGQVLAEIHQGQLELALERERIAQEMMTEIEKENAAERERIAKAESRAKTQAIDDFWSNATSLMNSGSRTMFEIGKAASLAQAVVDGYAAITGAYKVGASIGGPALGAAFGAAAAAATYTQIQAIRNASFGSGGSGGASSAAAAGSVTGGINAQGQAVTGQTESRQVLTVQGIDPNQMFSGRQLVDIINQAQKDGALLQVQD